MGNSPLKWKHAENRVLGGVRGGQQGRAPGHRRQGPPVSEVVEGAWVRLGFRADSLGS